MIWGRILGEPPGQTWREARMKREDLSRIGQLMVEGTAVDEAARQGVRDAIPEHVREGRPIVIERNGRIVWISPEELERELNADGW